jgi:pyruvoyl-dependent arginine decarboxylase (PvlArgDC)
VAFFTKRSSVHKDYLTSFELALIDANGRSQSEVSIKDTFFSRKNCQHLDNEKILLQHGQIMYE